MFKFEDLGENYPSSPYVLAYASRPGLTLVTVATKTFFRNSGWYEWREKQQRARNFKVFEFWSSWFNTERWRTLKNSILCCWHHFLRGNWSCVRNLWLAAGWKVTLVDRENTLRWGEGIVNGESVESGRMCLFVVLLLPRISRLHYSAFLSQF